MLDSVWDIVGEIATFVAVAVIAVTATGHDADDHFDVFNYII